MNTESLLPLLAVSTAVSLVLAPVSGRGEQALQAEELVQHVLHSNPSLVASVARATALQEAIEPALALDDPRASYALAPQTIGSGLGARHNLQISQSLPWPGKRRLRGAVATALADVADTDVTSRKRELVAQARELWAQWWYVHRALRINAANAELLDELQPVARTRYALGIGGQQDLLQVQTRLVHNGHRRIELRQQRRRLAAGINALRNSPGAAAPGEPADLPLLTALPSTADLQAMLLAQHPQLAALTFQQRAATASLELAQRNGLPDFQLNAGYVGALDPPEKRLQIGAAISIPLQRGRRQAETRAAAARLTQLDAEHRELSNQLLGELEQWLADAEQHRHVARLYSGELLALAQQNLRAARADYESGAGDFSNIIAAAQQQLQFQLELARARADWLIARARLSQLAGVDWAVTGEAQP